MEGHCIQPVIGAEVLEYLDRRNEVAASAICRILLSETRLMLAGESLFPVGCSRSVEQEGFMDWLGIVVGQCWIDGGQNLNPNAEVHLDAHTVCAVANLTSISAVALQRTAERRKNLVA